MSLHIVVCLKQVIDPEMPASAYKLDEASLSLAPPAGTPQRINNFDEIALEAALRIKDNHDAHITALSAGSNLMPDVMQRALALGADDLVFVQDARLENAADSYVTARVLSHAIWHLGTYDLVLCGRQASDWDNAQVPIGLAEMLEIPCVTLASRIEVNGNHALIERFLIDESVIVETSLPAVVAVTNELGEVRNPTLRGIMASKRRQPTAWTIDDIGLETELLEPRVELMALQIPEVQRQCRMVGGSDEQEAGANLAVLLREEGLI
jgi:electron transfer flavoprotein beta subunit